METKLTEREKEIYKLFVFENVTMLDVAKRLNLSTHTIKNYLQKIYLKLGVRSIPEMIRHYYQAR